MFVLQAYLCDIDKHTSTDRLGIAGLQFIDRGKRKLPLHLLQARSYHAN